MRRLRVALALIVAVTLAHIVGYAQTPAAGPTFDVVSVKPVPRERGFAGPVMMQRLDGGLTMNGAPMALILTFAYQPLSSADMVGLPDWATREYYDISATASLSNPSMDDRTAMLRAMLADRFRLLAHRERRELPSFDLVVARDDGKLGRGLVKIDTDCNAVMEARRAAAEAAVKAGGTPPPPERFDPDKPPPCTFVGMPNGIRAEGTMATLASMLRNSAGRFVVDKTGLTGTYRVNLTFDVFATIRAPGAQPPSDDVPSVFTAVREQLGLRLESSRTERDVLVIDRLERPTEN